MKKVLLFILAVSMVVMLYYFSGSTSNPNNETAPKQEIIHDYEPETGGINQLADYKIQNSSEQAVVKLELAVQNPAEVNFSYQLLDADTPIYVGEGKEVEPSLGAYRVELMLTDVRLQKKLVQELGTRVVPVASSPDELLQAIKVSYPLDDASLVIYLGCRAKPEVKITHEERSLIITLTGK